MASSQEGIGQQLDIALPGTIENGKPKAALGDIKFFEGAAFRFVKTDEAIAVGKLCYFSGSLTNKWLVNIMPTATTWHQAGAGFCMVTTTTTNTHFWTHVAGQTTSKSPSLIAASGTAGLGIVPDTTTAGSVKDGTVGTDDARIVATALIAVASSAITWYLARMAR